MITFLIALSSFVSGVSLEPDLHTVAHVGGWQIARAADDGHCTMYAAFDDGALFLFGYGAPNHDRPIWGVTDLSWTDQKVVDVAKSGTAFLTFDESDTLQLPAIRSQLGKLAVIGGEALNNALAARIRSASGFVFLYDEAKLSTVVHLDDSEQAMRALATCEGASDRPAQPGKR
jgi:hypothetical protein